MTAPLCFEDVALPGLGSRITLEVPQHRAVVVTGPEASGVDVLPGYALALKPPPAGRVLLFGEDVAHNLSLKDNVALPLRYGSDLTEREIDGRIRIMLTMVKLGAAPDLRPAEATEEQRRRTALARALAFDPHLVILADPFDGLPTRAAAELLELARGGETETGSRRTVFMTGQSIPQLLESRVEVRYRLTEGALVRDA
jgi:ABC-type transporter Mla maintaining outer membrane lipid asymmetry ATPase subunit MlaF